MFRKAYLILFLLVFFFIFPLKAYAVSVVIINPPATIGSDPFQVSVTITGASAGTNYLRVDLYKDGATNYFGETFNGSSWYSGSEGTQYLPVTIPSDSPFTIQARIGDTIPNTYDGTGTYKLRIRRYTASGNYNNDEAKESAVTVAIAFPTVTPTPSDTPTPTHTPTPIHSTSSGQAKIPTPTKSPTSIPTIAKAATFVPTTVVSMVSSASTGAYPTTVLGASISAKPTPKKLPDKKVIVQASNNNAAIIGGSFVIAALFFGACAILVYRRKISQESFGNAQDKL